MKCASDGCACSIGTLSIGQELGGQGGGNFIPHWRASGVVVLSKKAVRQVEEAAEGALRVGSSRLDFFPKAESLYCAASRQGGGENA
jgi:hypothetical protein